MKKCQIIVSEGIEQINDISGNITTKLVQPILSFRLPFVPSALSFHIMVVTTGYDYTQGIDFGFKIFHLVTNEILQEQTPVKLHLPGGDFSNFNLNIDAKNVSIMKKGEYIIEVRINEDNYSHSFYVDALVDHLTNE